MADRDFEQFRKAFEKSLHIKTPFYSLVHDVGLDDTIDGDDEDNEDDEDSIDLTWSNGETEAADIGDDTDCDIGSVEYNRDRKKISKGLISAFWDCTGGERKRRKLPEIPSIKNKKTRCDDSMWKRQLSLADELQSSSIGDDENNLSAGADVDSGHSTSHSPIGNKSLSPAIFSLLGSTVVYNDIEMLEPTHRGLHKFVPRHNDEIDIEIGDALYVHKEFDDLWSEGVNLRTGRLGIFPSAYAVDCDYSEWDSTFEHGRRERFLLGYLGSVETLAHKGTSVVCQAVRRVIGTDNTAQPCILEISDQGLRMVDRKKRNQNEPCIDYFYSLKNVSFCAFHPKDHRYLGFITKHPTLQRFACHIFQGPDTTRPIAEAVGRAFQRFYQKFVDTAYPVEDIYIE